MIAGVASPTRRRAARFLAALAISTFLPTTAVLAQQPEGAANAEAFPALPAILEKNYRTIRSLVVTRGDCVVFEYYRDDIAVGTLSPVYSVTKSVLSILIGMAIDGGDLRLDQKLSELLPETSETNVDPRVREISVRDLLTMTAGFDPAGNHASKVSVPESETWRWLLERPMKYPPGSHFDYDEAEQNLLSIVLTRAIKQDAGAFAERNLFAPLHIVDHHRVSEADGYLLGATGLFLTGRDMAKLGLLYLQRGRWGENQIVSDAFVIDSTTKHNEGGAPSHDAYGYFWWTKPTKAGLDAFFAAGHNSQLIYVIPKLDLVVAVAAEKIPGGSVDFVNNLVLPAAAELPASAPCVARLEQGRAD